MANDKIRLGDILWEYADFPPTKPSSLAPKAPERRSGVRVSAPPPVQKPHPAPAAPSEPAPKTPAAKPPVREAPKPKAPSRDAAKAHAKTHPPDTAEPVYDSALENTLTYSVGAFVQEELAKAGPPPPPSQTPEPKGKAEKVKELLDRATKPPSQQDAPPPEPEEAPAPQEAPEGGTPQGGQQMAGM